ncbi:hypothetical protein Y032_0002g597 [Ancylostoma ceylanicum]|uniref:Uncharacterized protein n=1 Tax=Ancylostoma ceylanicum TaxID=53326 RepID=A0A016W0K9_9BILA|nr:hypothetical protein Y032_0002g597 [Ancylostoma ceylanicum]
MKIFRKRFFGNICLYRTNSELQSAVNKLWERGATFLGRDTGALNVGAWEAPVSLAKNAVPRSRTLSTAVWNPLRSF